MVKFDVEYKTCMLKIILNQFIQQIKQIDLHINSI